MEKMGVKNGLLFALVVFTTLFYGCSAVEHRNLETSSKLSQAIFLNEETVSDGKPIYVHCRNQSDVPNLDFQQQVIQDLKAKGYRVTRSAKEADEELNVVFVALEKEKEGMTATGALAGGFGGAIVGNAVSNNGGGTLIGGATGALAGAAIGSMFHVDKWFGVVDVQIKERVKGKARQTIVSGSAQAEGMTTGSGMNDRRVGSASIRGQGSSTRYEANTDKIAYYTRIVVTASQTNLNQETASNNIAKILSHEVANFF